MTAADLSEKQVEALRLMIRGYTRKQMADALGLCLNAVTGRILRLRQLAGVRTDFQLGAWAERHGIREAGPA